MAERIPLGGLNGITTTIPSFLSSGNSPPFTTFPLHSGTSGVGAQSGGSVLTAPSAGLSIATFVSFFLELFLALVVLSVIGVFIIIVVANRADPDPSGRRPQAVYYFAVSFVTLFVTIVGSALVVSGVDALIGNHSNAVSNTAARAILLGALSIVIGAVLLVVHLRRGLDLVRSDTQPPAPSAARGSELRVFGCIHICHIPAVSLRVVCVPDFRPGGTGSVRSSWRPRDLGSRARRRDLSVDRRLGRPGNAPQARISRTRHLRSPPEG